MVGRAGLEPATICALNVWLVCQADILTRLDDRPRAAVNAGPREIKATESVMTIRLCYRRI